MGIRLMSYFGSKIRIAKLYPRPLYPTIVEPFAGAAGYSCRYWRRRCILWEINPAVFGALRYIIKADPKDVLSLPLLKGKEQKIRDLPISNNAKRFIGFWASTAAKEPGTCLHQWARESESRATWSRPCRKRASITAGKIKHWSVHHGSYTEIPVDQYGPCTWFVDPPYQEAGRCYTFGSKLIDYNHLADWCRSLPGQVIVCENLGADWLPFRVLCETRGAVRDGGRSRRTTEVIWTKGCDEYLSLME